jgi:hypothetical protein
MRLTAFFKFYMWLPLFKALADEAALAPVKALHEEGIPAWSRNITAT